MYRNKAFIGILLMFCILCAAPAKDNKFDENLYIMEAIMAADRARHEEAMNIYKKLYDNTKKPTYLKEALKLAYFADSSEADQILKLSEKELKDDPDFLRIKSMKLMGEKKFNEAVELMQTLIKKESFARNHIVLGSIFAMQNKKDDALKQFEKAYEIDKKDENLIRVAEFLFNNMNRHDEAIGYLETSRRMNGCGTHICMNLIDFYIRSNRLNNTIEIYEELYGTTKESEFLDKALGVYIYQKNYDGAIKFLNKHSYNDDALMEIYVINGDFDSAYKKAKEMLDRTFNLDYQAKMAVYQYERDSKNIDKKSLDEIIYNFEKSAVKLDNPIYLNYYGYLLIDHDIDPKKGVELVEKALIKDPDSSYYIDSLAWGHFKLGDCKKADEIMQKTMHDKEFIESEEAKEHIRMIKECLKKGGK